MDTFLLVLLCFVPPQAPPVYIPPQAPPVIDSPVGDFPRIRYLAAWSQSLASGKPLVTFVGTPTMLRIGDVAVPVEMPRGWFDDYPSTCVIIGRPSGDTLHGFRTLSAVATEDDIRSAIAPRPVMQQPAFQPQMFAPSFGGGGFSRGGGGSC